MTIRFLLFGIGILAGISWSSTATASVLTPFGTESGFIGQPVTIEVRLDSQGETINAVEAALQYDPSVLRLADLSTGRSFLTLWTEPPAEFIPGLITASGGLPVGTVSSGGRVFSATFIPLRAGLTKLSVMPEASGVYISDGTGQPTSLETKSIGLNIQAVDPFAPRLTSPTHPRPAEWSRQATFRVEWDVLPLSVVSYQISRDQSSQPDDFADENVGVIEYPNLEDGVWYFTLKTRLSGEAWGPVASWPVWIDRTPPLPFSVDMIEAGAQRLVSFVPYDATSGFTGANIQIERSRWWKPWSRTLEITIASSPLTVSDIRSIRRVVVSAFDAAGNSRTSTWVSPRFVDGSRLLVLLALIATLVLASILLLIVLDRHPAARRGLARRRRVR